MCALPPPLVVPPSLVPWALPGGLGKVKRGTSRGGRRDVPLRALSPTLLWLDHLGRECRVAVGVPSAILAFLPMVEGTAWPTPLAAPPQVAPYPVFGVGLWPTPSQVGPHWWFPRGSPQFALWHLVGVAFRWSSNSYTN